MVSLGVEVICEGDALGGDQLGAGEQDREGGESRRDVISG